LAQGDVAVELPDVEDFVTAVGPMDQRAGRSILTVSAITEASLVT